MRSKVRPSQRVYSKDEWHPWFVWYPKRIYIGPKVPTTHKRPYLWVWRETVERINTTYIDQKRAALLGTDYNGPRWQYRISVLDENLCSSNAQSKTEETETS